MTISRTNLIAYGLFALSLLILAGTAYFMFNIKVLENWTLTVKQADIHVGDTVIVESTYTKLRTTGSDSEATRYIICKNSSNVWVRYEVSRATANRAAGKGGTGIPITIRRDIADVPTTCKFSIVISYKVLPFRTVVVANESNEFLVLPERTVPITSAVPAQVPIASTPSRVPTSNAPAAVSGSSRSSYSPSSNPTPSNTPRQPDNSQSTEPVLEVRSPLSPVLCLSVLGQVRVC